MDIRSFFSVVSKKKQDAPEQDLLKVTKKNSQRKRAIIESDSDEERSPPKKTKVSPRSNNGPNNGKKKRNEESPVKSKYFETNAQNMFGGEPIKKIPPKKIVKKKAVEDVVEIQSDSDFEAALMQMDDVDPDEWEKKPNSSNTLTPKKSLNKTADKKDSGKSSSSSLHCISPEKSPCTTRTKEDSASVDIKNPVDNISSEKSPGKIPDSEGISKVLKNNTKSIQENKESQNYNKKEKYKKEDDLFEETNGKYKNNIVKNKEVSVKTNEDKKTEHSFSNIKMSNSNANKVCSQEAEESSLWVDKYRPKTLKNIVGQQGDKSNVKKLLTWLQNWHKNHTSGKKLTRPSPWVKDDSGAFFKAALLSGPPGVGKTTTAHLVCKEIGFDVVEFNASDTRSKKMLHQEISELLSSKSLTPYFTGGGTKARELSKNHALVMDEVDGMAGNEDRGGVQELIQLIKTTQIPIICMCNDRNHPKIRSLANYCFDLRFQRPRAEQIRGAMMSVCFKENLKVAPNTLMDIISCANQDIRLVLNHLSMLAAQNSNLENSKKHIKLGPWDVLRLVFSQEEHKTMSIYDKCDLFFHDYSIGPLFVQENYLNVAPHSEDAKNKRKRMELFAKAAYSISLGDVTDRVIRSQNAWNLLPVQAIFSSFVPGEVLEGHMSGQINFPSWLGKNSKRGRLDRLLQEVQIHTRLRVSASKEAMNLDYLIPLHDHIVRPLVQQGSEGITAALNSLQEYNLVREDLDSLNELRLWPSSKDPMAKIESKVKAGFTRAYNKSGMLPPYAMSSVIKKGKGMPGAEDGLENEDDIAEVGDNEEEESVEVDAMITVKKKPTKRPAAEPVAASSSKGKGGGKRIKTSKK